MGLIHHPELGVQDTMGQLLHVHHADLGTCDRQQGQQSGVSMGSPRPATLVLPAHHSGAGIAGQPEVRWVCSQRCEPSHLEVPEPGAAGEPLHPVGDSY